MGLYSMTNERRRSWLTRAENLSVACCVDREGPSGPISSGMAEKVPWNGGTFRVSLDGGGAAAGEWSIEE